MTKSIESAQAPADFSNEQIMEHNVAAFAKMVAEYRTEFERLKETITTPTACPPLPDLSAMPIGQVYYIVDLTYRALQRYVDLGMVEEARDASAKVHIMRSYLSQLADKGNLAAPPPALDIDDERPAGTTLQ